MYASTSLYSFLVKCEVKNGFVESFPFQNIYNYVRCINGSKVTVFNVFQAFTLSLKANNVSHASSVQQNIHSF